MSEFTSNFWSIYVAAISILGIVFCAALLWFSGSIKVHSSDDNTTGHVWDENLAELNNPLPRWWLWLFYVTIIWSVGYWVVYPSWPLVSSYTKGAFGWQSREAVVNELAALKAQRGPMMDKLASATPAQIAA